MRAWRLRLRFLSIVLLLSFAGAEDDVSPFHPPAAAAATAWLNYAPLARRAKTKTKACPSGYSSCEGRDAAGVCCESDTVCATDEANNMACCPSGAVCTGVISTPTDTGTTTAATSSTTSPPSTTAARTTAAATTTESDFRPPATPTGGPSSTVPDAAFPFIYIPTTFSNQDACIDAYYGCQSQLSDCTASLGGAHGVTIGGGGSESGMGTTVAGSTPTADVQSVCTSLRDEACYGLQVGFCTALAEEGGAPSSAGGPGGAAPASALYEIVAGLAIALAGMVA